MNRHLGCMIGRARTRSEAVLGNWRFCKRIFEKKRRTNKYVHKNKILFKFDKKIWIYFYSEKNHKNSKFEKFCFSGFGLFRFYIIGIVLLLKISVLKMFTFCRIALTRLNKTFIAFLKTKWAGLLNYRLTLTQPGWGGCSCHCAWHSDDWPSLNKRFKKIKRDPERLNHLNSLIKRSHKNRIK